MTIPESINNLSDAISAITVPNERLVVRQALLDLIAALQADIRDTDERLRRISGVKI